MKKKVYSIITGATSGIGKALAYKLGKEDYNMILIARNKIKLENLCKDLERKYNVKVLIYSMDITNREEIYCFDKWLEENYIKVGLFVNNAGVGSFGKFNKIDTKEDLNIIDTNITGFTHLLKVVCKYILRGGTILQVASTAAFAPGPYMSVYYASKAYVLSLSLAIREELRKEGIEVCILCPGPTKTEFQKIAKMKKAEFTNKLAMNVEEVAHVAYRGILKNKALIVPGIANKIAVLGMSIIPINLSAKVVGLTQKGDKEGGIM